MSRVRIIALGNDMAGDDAAALDVVRRLEARLVATGSDGELDMILAGRPGADLLDLLPADVPTVLVDVTRSGAAPGTIFNLGLDELNDAITGERHVSSHGFGPGDALRLGKALGRALPQGRFVGVEGRRFEAGAGMSAEVAGALDATIAAVLQAARDLGARVDAQAG